MKICETCEREIPGVDETSDAVCPHCKGGAPAANPERTLECSATDGERPKQTIDTLDLSSVVDDSRSLTKGTCAATGLVGEGMQSKHQVGSLLARGGMGLVFDARDANVRRQVAMKVMRKDKAQDQSALIRFVEEAQITGQLEHPNIVPVYELGVDRNDSTFYTMKLISGVTLADVLSRIRKGDTEMIQRFPLSALLDVFLKVCDAIDYAHSKNVVHRDLKPSNVMIGDYGEVLVVDWGLAKVYPAEAMNIAEIEDALNAPDKVERYVESVRTADDGSFHTLVGQVMGTPGFMSPEQALGFTQNLDGRTDVFALGAILYNILTLRLPYRAKSSEELIRKALQHSPEPIPAAPDWDCPHLPNGRIPDGLKAVAMKALKKSPDNRYATVGAMSKDVRSWISGFATMAEGASFGRQLSLLIARRKKEFTMAAVAGLCFVVMLTVFVFRLNHEKTLAQTQRDRAQEAEILAQTERNAAQLAETKATDEEKKAKAALKDAVESRRLAQKEKLKADQENYFTAIGLAQTRIENGLYGQAEEILWSLPSTHRHWEWGWLMRECTMDTYTFPVEQDTEWGDLAVSLDGQWLATPNRDGSIRIWSAYTGKKELDLLGHEKTVNSVVFSPDGKYLASAGDDNTVIIWSVDPWDVKHKLTGHYADILDLAFSPDGGKLATSSRDGCTKIWNTSDWSVKLNLTGQKTPAGTVFMPDGRRVVTAGGDGTVCIWSVSSARRLARFPTDSTGLRCVATSPDGQLVATAGNDGVIRVLRTNTGSGLFRLRLPGALNALSFSPDGTRLAAASEDGIIWLFNAKDASLILQHKGHSDSVTSLQFSPKGRFLFSSSVDGRVKVWNAERSSRLRTLVGRRRSVGVARFFDGDDRVVTATRGQVLAFWNPKTLRPESTIAPLSVMVKDVVVDWTSRRAMILGLHGHGIMLDLQSKKELFHFGSNVGDCRFAADLSADGQLIASADTFGPEIRIWDAATGQQKFVAKGHGQRCNAVKFSPDGTQLATASFNGEVGLWDTQSGANTASINAHLGIAECVAFSPTDNIVVSGGEDRYIRVWNAKSGTLVKAMRGHLGSVLHLAFSADGHRLVSVGLDNVLRVWETSQWRELVALRRSGDPRIYKRMMYRENMNLMKMATFSQNMKHIVTDIPEVWTAVDLSAERQTFQQSRHTSFLKLYSR